MFHKLSQTLKYMYDYMGVDNANNAKIYINKW